MDFFKKPISRREIIRRSAAGLFIVGPLLAVGDHTERPGLQPMRSGLTEAGEQQKKTEVARHAQ
jgi:hypothetical protein